MDLINTIADDWKDILIDDKLLDILKKIEKKDIDIMCPHPSLIFNFTHLTKFDDIKIVILGQDPYSTKDTANGLAFSSMTNISPSLKNIYKCLLNHKLINELPKTGNLTNWAKQGILLLNTCLTTELGKPLAHKKLWEEYTGLLIDKISAYKYNRGIDLLFMLWGKYAQTMEYYISTSECNILTWCHPSPLAQVKCKENSKFIHCDHFKIATDKFNINWDPLYEGSNYSNRIEKISTIVKTNKFTLDLDIDKWVDSVKYTNDKCVVFTDGSCHPNNKSKESKGGYAILFTSGQFKKYTMYGKLNTDVYYASNIRAEGICLIKIFEHIIEYNINIDHDIMTDSQFWIDMINKYIPSWIKKGIDFETKSNSDMTTLIWELYEKASIKCNINLIHVRSHNKNGWKDKEIGSYERFCYECNNIVDQMANYARLN